VQPFGGGGTFEWGSQ